MASAVDNLNRAMAFAMANRPAKGSFPFLAEVLRQAGVQLNVWELPSGQSTYITESGNVSMTSPVLPQDLQEIPAFEEAALITALRRDQAGESTFPEFLTATWQAGVVRYIVDLEARTCTYYGILGESYEESYPAMAVNYPAA